jgi:8-amino-7-oxononanoate synthase
MPSEFHQTLMNDLQAGLRGLEARSQRRTLTEISGINLCSNDYLGLSEHPALREAVAEAICGTARISGTGARLLSGHAAVWSAVEEEFSEFVGAEASLYFGSGYSANIGLLTSLAGKNDIIFSDELNHASLIDGIRLSGARKVIYPHVDLNALEEFLSEHQQEKCRKFIVTESVFGMDGDIAPIDEIVSLADRYGAGVIVDEAHATAVHGPGGRGVAAAALASRRIIAAIHTCGKALAGAGAFVCGTATLREHLINHARTFIFSTALPPYMATQIRAALRLAIGMNTEREELLARSAGLASAFRRQGWDTSGTASQIVPVVIGRNDHALSAAEFLQKRGFAVRAIRPPTVAEGTSRLRFSMTHKIGVEDLRRLTADLNSWFADQQRLKELAMAGTA